MRELEADARAIIEQRTRMIGELRELVRRLGEFADAAAGRNPSSPPAAPQTHPPA